MTNTDQSGLSVAKRPAFDDVAPARRRNMAAIRGKNTKPELRARSLLHRAGYRFRLHRTDLPGRPDIVLPGRRVVIVVHGCFWHRHGCSRSTLPRTRGDWWEAKLNRNVERDRQNQQDLEALGWRMVVVWECELRNEAALLARLDTELRGSCSPTLPDVLGKG